MFWKYNASSSPQIEALLGKEDVTLLEVMDSDDIINECRVQNKVLIDFLQKPNVMEELVTLTTKEPSIELDERVRFKYSNIACELLTCDVPALNERLASDELLLDKLYNFLDSEPPLNPLLASFFSKILGVLIAKKTEQVLDFLKAKDTFISLLLKHLGTSAIMDLMLKLFTQVEGIETKQNILNVFTDAGKCVFFLTGCNPFVLMNFTTFRQNRIWHLQWLDSQQIIQSLVSMFNPNIDKDRHYNVAQLLCDFIRIARDNQRNSMERADPDPLLNTVESYEIVALLLEKMLEGDKCESAIIGGIQVLLALLDVNHNSTSRFNSTSSYNNINDEPNDVEIKRKVLNNITSALLEWIDCFHNLLLDPPKKMPMELTVGVLDPPFGQTRLQVLKLFASVIMSNNSDLLEKMISLKTFPLMLELFFKYPWNNFLHTQVERCLLVALKTYVSEDVDETAIALCNHFLENCRLIEILLEAWKENDNLQKDKGVRQGYMGHLISILNEIIDLCSKTYLGQFLKKNYSQTHFILEQFRENTLNEVIKTQRSLLGGAHPNTSNNNDSDEFSDSTLPQSIASQQQQMYAEYQMQYLNSRFIDGYSGFNDDTFNESGDTLQSIDQTTTNMNFDISDNTFAIQVFKQLCSQNINTLDDSDDQIFEEKDHTFQTVIEKQGDRNGEQTYSSDSDDESLTEDNAMDVDPWSTSKLNTQEGDDSGKVISDPWCNSSNNSSDANSGTWANFNSTTFEADFSKAFESQFSTNIHKEKKQESFFVDMKEIEIVKETQKTFEIVKNDIEVDRNIVDKNETDTKTGDVIVGHDKTNSAKGYALQVAAGDQKENIKLKNEIELNEPSNSGNMNLGT